MPTNVALNKTFLYSYLPQQYNPLFKFRMTIPYGAPGIWVIEQFLTTLFNQRVWLNLVPFVEDTFTPSDWGWVYFFTQKFKNFENILTKRLGSFQLGKAFFFAIGCKDVRPLIKIFRRALERADFWKHRTVIHMIRHIFLILCATFTKKLSFKGLKFTFKGKISVGGNSRSRTHHFQNGRTSFSEKNNRIITCTSLVHTFTGVLSLRLWISF